MKHNTKYLVLAAALAGLGIGAVSAASAQGSDATPSNASPPSNAGPQAGHWRGAGPMRPGGGWNHRGDQFHRAGWNHRRGGRHGHWRGRRGMRRGQGAMLVGVLLRQVRQLDLSSQQRDRVRDILSQARKQRQSNASRPALDIAVLGDPGSRGYAQAVQNAKSRAADRIQRQSELATQVYNVLTPTQKRNLATLLAADQVRMQARQQRMQQLRQRMQQRMQQRRSGSGGGSSSSAG